MSLYPLKTEKEYTKKRKQLLCFKKKKEKIAFVNLDLDSLSDYSSFFNLGAVVSEDKTLEITIPRIVDLFNQLDIKATFFTIAADALKNKKYIRMLHENGHEIGNHTLNHKVDLKKLPFREKYHELIEADKILSDMIGKKIVGFRAPNYLLDKETWDVLAAHGYLYDSSVFPTLLTPLFELYSYVKYQRACRIDWSTLVKSNMPYYLRCGLLEIPVSVTPFTRLPFMGSYMQILGFNYFQMTFREMLFSKNINFELHLYEFMNKDEDGLHPNFDALPQIKVPLRQRIAFLEKQIARIKNNYRICTLEAYARQVLP